MWREFEMKCIKKNCYNKPVWMSIYCSDHMIELKSRLKIKLHELSDDDKEELK